MHICERPFFSRCDNIAHSRNGCEGIGIESGDDQHDQPVNDNLFLHMRYQGDAGIVIANVRASGNLFRDFVLDGGFGIAMGLGRLQENNTFTDGEIRGGKLGMDGSSRRNIVRNVTFVGPRPTRANQHDQVANTSLPAYVISNFVNNPGVDYVDPPGSGSVKVARMLDGWTVHD